MANHSPRRIDRLARRALPLVVIAMLVPAFPRVAAAIHLNLGWAQAVSVAYATEVPAHDQVTNARRQFQSSLAWQAYDNQAARHGLQLMTAQLQEYDSLFTHQALAGDDATRTEDSGPLPAQSLPARSLLSGEQALLRENPNLALALFRAGGNAAARAANRSLSPADADAVVRDAETRAGEVCQLAILREGVLDDNNRCFCADLFAANGGNLLLNGDLHDSEMRGWRGGFFFADETRRQLSTVTPANAEPYLQLKGMTAENHNGPYQPIYLPPGSTVEFSGWFRTSPAESDSAADFTARLLYIGWQEEGAPRGNQAAIVQESTDWTYVARTFTLPARAEGQVLFFPAQMSGHGTVQARSLAVTLLEANEQPALERCTVTGS